MDVSKQRIKATAARKKEERLTKGTEEGDSSIPKSVSKVSKRIPVLEGPCSLLIHKGYAVGELGSFVKPTDLEPCDLVGTKDLGASALFDITRVCLLS